MTSAMTRGVTHRQTATVQTTFGRVRGRQDGGVFEFLGVPFAAPPVGPLRFQTPQRPEPWDGERDATTFGATAPQQVLPAALLPQTLIPGDDCLHVNVHTPALGSAGLPVLVWIHGGGMVVGSNADPWVQGGALASRGFVVVSANYRLGADGFLLLDGAPPNRGVLDWLAALSWVHENVAIFGGDPSQITVGGARPGRRRRSCWRPCPRPTDCCTASSP